MCVCVCVCVYVCVCHPESSLQWQWAVRGSRLELGPLSLAHAGTYTCVVQNSEGRTQKNYVLTVQGRFLASGATQIPKLALVM